jgi:glucose-1-phosphate adenylyltransferase
MADAALDLLGNKEKLRAFGKTAVRLRSTVLLKIKSSHSMNLIIGISCIPAQIGPTASRLKWTERKIDLQEEANSMRDVLAIILGGGRGTRLFPLTQLRAKPAVPIAGKYRLIDIPVSNCINSNVHKIYVLTQFNSASLNRHISQSYPASPFSDGFVEILAAQQTPEHSNWFQGTADAVRQYLPSFLEHNVNDYLILSGDHLYRMNYQDFIAEHRQNNADITVSVIPVTMEKASEFGLLKIDNKGCVSSFVEKPQGAELQKMQVDTVQLGLEPMAANKMPFIASMGIYVFKRQVLQDLLAAHPDTQDFGREILPIALDSFKVAYLFKGYWKTSEPFNRSMRPTSG